MADKWRKYLEAVKRRALARPVDYRVDGVKNMHKKLGRPGDKFPWVHVTGTNGKGSYVAKVSSALIKSGHKVGVFTSPHIGTIRERISIDNEMIPKEFCWQFWESLQKMGHAYEQLSYFDIQVLMALEYFKTQNVDLAVVEVGLGGKNDSTNLGESTLLAAITNIALDHTEVLGKSLASILGRIC